MSTEIPIPPPASIDLRDWGLLLLLSIIWGGSYLFIGVALRELSPLVVVMARVIIAATALLPVHFLLQGSLPSTGPAGSAWPACRSSTTSFPSC